MTGRRQLLALFGPREMSDLSPHRASKRNWIKAVTKSRFMYAPPAGQ
jgi:hypothetical protein